MDPFGVNMLPGTSMAAHIDLLHASIEVHAQDPSSVFHNPLARAQRLLWSLPMVFPWVEFRMRYFDFMITGNPGLDGPRFQAQGAWATLTTELLLREEFVLRGITIETLLHAFPLYQAPPPPVAPAPAQGPPSPPAPGAPAMPESPGEVHVVVDLPDTPEIVVVSSGEEGYEEEDPEEDDPEEDPGSDEMQEDQQVGQGEDHGGEQEVDQMVEGEEDQGIEDLIEEQPVELEASDAEAEASTSSFDSGEEPDDDSDPDYDPSRDR